MLIYQIFNLALLLFKRIILDPLSHQEAFAIVLLNSNLSFFSLPEPKAQCELL